MKEDVIHYKEVKVQKGIFLRFFYTFQAKKHLEGKWVLVLNKEKKYSLFTDDGVELLHMLKAFDINYFKEITEVTRKGVYTKTVIKPNGKIKVSKKKLPQEEEEDKSKT